MNLWHRLRLAWEATYSYAERANHLDRLETKMLSSPAHAALLSEIGCTESDLVEVLARAKRGVPEMWRIERAMMDLDFVRWALAKGRESGGNWDAASNVAFVVAIRYGRLDIRT